MGNMTDVSYKEHFDVEIRWLKTLIDERDRSTQIALNLQAKEYERRLETLNHENARILEAQSKSVSLEKYELEIERLQQDLVTLQKKDSTDIGRKEGATATWAYVLAGIAIIISIVGIVL